MSKEKKCPSCAELVKEEAIKCKHCGHNFKPKSPKIILILSALGVLLVLSVIGSNEDPEKAKARHAISICWDDYDNPDIPSKAFIKQVCQKMVNDFESKYGRSLSLRRQ